MSSPKSPRERAAPSGMPDGAKTSARPATAGPAPSDTRPDAPLRR
ncbi:hypothetical protein ACXYTP_03605 [Tsukamurella ocularis]